MDLKLAGVYKLMATMYYCIKLDSGRNRRILETYVRSMISYVQSRRINGTVTELSRELKASYHGSMN